MNYKEIKIGPLIKQRVEELSIDPARICRFLGCSDREVRDMYAAEHLRTDVLLRWSKLLEYDFFRLYSQHIILYAPQNEKKPAAGKVRSALPHFRKNIYSSEMIAFIMELIDSGQKTQAEIIKEYGIPKTTLFKWVQKHTRI